MISIEEVFALHNETTDQLLSRFGKIVLAQASDFEKQKVYQALGIVLVAHSGDRRRRPDSCINHILRATIYLVEFFEFKIELVLTALLHDLMEDHPDYLPVEKSKEAQFKYLAVEFGQEVSDSVQMLTLPQEIIDEEKTREAKHTKYHSYIDSVFDNEKVLIVKFCDYFDNIITTGLSTNVNLKKECTPRYLPLIEKYQIALENIESAQYLRSNYDIYFTKIRELFSIQ